MMSHQFESNVEFFVRGMCLTILYRWFLEVGIDYMMKCYVMVSVESMYLRALYGGCDLPISKPVSFGLYESGCNISYKRNYSFTSNDLTVHVHGIKRIDMRVGFCPTAVWVQSVVRSHLMADCLLATQMCICAN